MMSGRTDLGLTPKRRVATTYGKNKNRSLLSSAAELRETAVRTTTTAQSAVSKVKDDDASARLASLSRQGSKEKVANANAILADGKSPSSSSITVGSSRQAGVASISAAPRQALKRKLVQQSTTQVVKKQRSSSPDGQPIRSAAPQTAPSPIARPNAATKVARITEGGRRLLLGSPASTAAKPLALPRVKSDKDQETQKGKEKDFQQVNGKEKEKQKEKQKEPPSQQRRIPLRPPQKAPTSQQTKLAFAPLKERAGPAASNASRPTKPAPPQAAPPASAPAPIRVALSPPAAPRSMPVKKRPRLIDTLNAQAEQSSSSSAPGSEDDSDVPILAGIRRTLVVEEDDAPISGRVSPVPTPAETPKPRTFTRQVSMNRKPGLKYTYSQQRTMLAEESLLDGLDPEAAAEKAFSQPLLPPTQTNDSTFDFDDGLVDASTSGAVRSIHELRQAGANSRFADEMDDILDRIGAPSSKPSSVRRNALLETAQKVQNKTFRRQFLNHHNATSSLLKGLRSETDSIAGFLVASILVTLLGTSTSSHLARQLPLADISQLLAFLLPNDSDIATLVKDRKSNLSRFAQSNLVAIKRSLLQLSVWDPSTPSMLSPRTLSLKCMHLILQQAAGMDDLDALFSADITDKLFAILSSAAGDRDAGCWDFPTQADSIDLFLAFSLLESLSIRAMESQIAAHWNSHYLPTVADILETALKHRAEQLGQLEDMVLRLTLNTANNNPDAHTLFLERGLLRDLTQAACSTFDSVLKAISEDSFAAPVLNSLVLMLGVMINFSEHDLSAGKTLDGFQPLDRLIGFFLENCSRTAEADSVEKSQLNVAFGYLSVLLGYLCQYAPIRERFRSMSTGGDLNPLLTSIREFGILHKVTDSATDPESETSFYHRLQAVVNDLASTHSR